MFLQFSKFRSTTSSVISYKNLLLRICCAFLIVSYECYRISLKPPFFTSCRKPSSWRSASPNSIISIFLFFSPDDMKIFHIVCASLWGSLASKSYFIFKSFLMVTTACFWKLWLIDFLHYPCSFGDEPFDWLSSKGM